LLSDRQLKKAIAELKSMEKNCFGSRQRFAFIVYLGAVLEFYSLLRRNSCAKRSADRIAELFRIRRQKRTHSIRVIIDASSAAEVKMKSRWTRALRFAWHERERWQSIKECFQENGGVAGAAERFTVLLPRNRQARVGLDMEDQVPTIPLVVDVELLKPGQLFTKGGKVFRQPDAAEADLQGNPESEPPGHKATRGGITEAS
jgi:hypothetical protein